MVLLVTCVPAGCLAEAGEVSLSCEHGREGNNISCTLANGLAEDVLWLASPFVLEGPLGGDSYVYRFVGGERIENTLEYGPSTIGRLGGPIQFKPTVYLSEADLVRLFRLSAGDDMVFSIRLDSAPRPGLVEPVERLFRAKVVVSKVLSLDRMIGSGELPPGCSDRIRLGLSPRAAPVEISVREPDPGPRYERDGCRDRISGEFEHVFSNELLAD